MTFKNIPKEKRLQKRFPWINCKTNIDYATSQHYGCLRNGEYTG